MNEHSSDSPVRDGADAERILVDLGATPETLPALLGYVENPYRRTTERALADRLPLADEAHLEAWREYAGEAEQSGAAQVLAEKLVQLRFPVKSGISQEDVYLKATRRGIVPLDLRPVHLENPGALRLEIQPTPAGAVPVVHTTHRTDFLTLVRSLAFRNEPVDLPDSMGACLVKGLINWDRVARYREHWQAKQDRATTEADWQAEFRKMAADKSLYQDTVLLLSAGPYAALAGSEIGLSDTQWQQLSLTIRRDHECFHYLTWRLFGSIRSNLLDELLADSAGLLSAFGHYRKEHALRFLGIEGGDTPVLAGEARLGLYRGSLEEDAIPTVLELAAAATQNLEKLLANRDSAELADPDQRAVLLLSLLEKGLIGLADRTDRTDQVENKEREPWTYSSDATTEGISRGLDEFEQVVERYRIADETRRKLSVVLDEILSNVAKYAYDDAELSTPGRVDVTLRPIAGNLLRLEVTDSGHAYDPLHQPAPDTLAALAGQRLGGLGIYLLRHIASDVQYRRHEGKNTLTVDISE